MTPGDIIAAINAAYSSEPQQTPRSYIGASGVGSPCTAELAFSLRGFPDNPTLPRLKRIFKLGYHIEDVAVADLKRAGLSVIEKDGLTNKQFAYQEFGGHVRCHVDGMVEVEEEVHLLEVKSMGDGPFGKFKAGGVKISHPKYYAQAQMAMGMSGTRRCLFIAYCKNNSEYHIEFIEFDDFEFAFLKEKVERVLGGQARKISVDDTDWRCRDCFKSDVCWRGTPVPHACLTCRHASPMGTGGWHCDKHGFEATRPCADWAVYEPLPKE
jgi:hypothetical protein